MKIKKSTKVIFSIIATLTLLYIILAARPLSPDYQFIPEWTKDISTTQYSTVGKDEVITFFDLGQSAGYFTAEGEILSSVTFPNKISISDYYYATYDTNSSDIPYYDKFGNKKGNLNTTGFPFFDEDRIYVFLPGGSSYSKFSDKGDLLWTNESVIPITAFASNAYFTATGYANGNITITNNTTGAIITDFSPDGSEEPVILGLDVSKNGKYTACISGHNKQRFLITETVENRQKIIYHKYLDTDLMTRTLIRFIKDNSKVLYVFDKGVGMYDIEKRKNENFDIDDNIIEIKETDDLIFLLGKTNNLYTVYFIEKTQTYIGKLSFTANTAFIQTLNNSLYIGKDNKLSKMVIKKD